MNPPLTKAKHGSTRCVECSKKFSETPDVPTIDIVGEERDAPGRNSVGFVHRHTTHPVTRRWHKPCYEEVEAWNAASWAEAQEAHWNMIRGMCEAAGLDFETVKAEHEARERESAAE